MKKVVRKSEDQGWSIPAYPYLGVRKEGEEARYRQVGEPLWVKSMKPRKGLQTDCVVHKDYESTEAKVTEQKRPVDQKDCPLAAEELGARLKRGEGRRD